MLLFWLSFLLAGLPAAPLPEPLANAQQAIKEMRGSVEAVEQARSDLRVLEHPDFVGGNYDTHLLASPMPPVPSVPTQTRDAIVVATALARLLEDEARAQSGGGATAQGGAVSQWRSHGRARVLRGG